MMKCYYKKNTNAPIWPGLVKTYYETLYHTTLKSHSVIDKIK